MGAFLQSAYLSYLPTVSQEIFVLSGDVIANYKQLPYISYLTTAIAMFPYAIIHSKRVTFRIHLARGIYGLLYTLGGVRCYSVEACVFRCMLSTSSKLTA